MKKTRHTPEQIIRMLRQAEAKLTGRWNHAHASSQRELGISEATFHRWKARYSGISSQEARRLKELQKENARLKKLLAEKELDIETCSRR